MGHSHGLWSVAVHACACCVSGCVRRTVRCVLGATKPSGSCEAASCPCSAIRSRWLQLPMCGLGGGAVETTADRQCHTARRSGALCAAWKMGPVVLVSTCSESVIVMVRRGGQALDSGWTMVMWPLLDHHTVLAVFFPTGQLDLNCWRASGLNGCGCVVPQSLLRSGCRRLLCRAPSSDDGSSGLAQASGGVS